MDFLKKGILITSLAGALNGCNQRTTVLEEVTIKRESIIRSMNELLSQSDIGLEKNEKCSIIIIGKNKNIDVILTCGDEMILRKQYLKNNGSEFQAEVSQVRVLDHNTLQIKSGCMVIEEGGIILMNPPNCTPNLTAPEAGKRFTI